MKWDSFAQNLSQKTSPVLLVAVGVITLGLATTVKAWLKTNSISSKNAYENLNQAQERTASHLDNLRALSDLKSSDVEKFKENLSEMGQSKKGFYETGLMLQGEKRLLEKQWEILTTYLMLDGEGQKIKLMRGDQSIESYGVFFGIPQIFGGEVKELPRIVKIISKERFAHPERGRSEKVGDQLIWTPPQVGTSVRSNALGEYVMFTNSSLILHGPPLKPEEHQVFPHTCLGLPLPTAKVLYQKCFIGTKITLDGGGE